MAQEIASLYARIGADTSGLKQGLDETKKGLTSAGDSFLKFSRTVTNALGIATGAAFTFKKIMDFGREGAVVIQTAESFDLLLEKIGAAPDLLRQLERASKNTVDRMTLMSSTATLLAGTTGRLATELANATPELLEIAKASNELNPRIGDTAFLYNSLATGIKRASPLILDNLGLTIRLEEAYQQYAESIGKSAQELTSEEQKIALLNATLSAGRVLINQASSENKNLVDSFDRLNTATTNLADAMKTKLAPSLALAAEAAALLLSWSDQINVALLEHNTEIADVSGSYEDYIREMKRAADAAGLIVQENNNQVRLFRIVGATVVEVEDDINILTRADYEYLRVARLIIDENHRLAGSFNVVEIASALAAGQMRDYAEMAGRIPTDLPMPGESLFGPQAEDFSLMELGLAGRLEEEKEAFKLAAQEIAFEMQGIQNEIDRLSSLPFLSPEQQSQLVALRNDLATLRGEYTAQADAHAEVTRRILVDLALQRIATLETTGALDIATANAARSMVFNMAQAWGLIDQTTVLAVTHMDQVFAGLADGSIKDVQAETLRLKSYLDSLVGVYPVNIVVTTSFLEQNPEVRFAPGFVPPGAGAPTPISGGGGGGFAQLPSLENEIKKLDPGRMALQLAQAYSQIGSTAASSLRTLLIDPLQEQIEAIDKLMGPGFIDIGALDRSAELEQMRAEAAERVAEAQEKILALEREQQRLAFLESQVRLLDLIEQNGLNAAKIFEGIDFTDPLSVIEATTRALQEQIAKAAEKLGITIPTLPTSGGPISTEIPPVNTAANNNLTVQLVIENVTDQIDVEVMAQRVAEVVKYRLLT